MRNSGFTIIELLIVIIILSILLAIAGLSGKTWHDRYRVEGQTKEMYTDLMNARVSAMQKNRIYFVTLSPLQYTIYEDRDPGHPFSTEPAYDGDGVFQGAAGDRMIVQKTTQYPIIPDPVGTTIFTLDTTGLVSLASTTATLHFDLTGSTVSPAYDCITLLPTRILMGKWSGTDCVNQ